MRRIYITEKQLRAIIKEETFTVYNPDSANNAAEPQNLDGTEVAVSDTVDTINGEHEHTDNPIPDTIKQANGKLYRSFGCRSMTEGKKKITEANKRVDNKTIRLQNPIERQRIQNDANNGSKVAQNIVNRGFQLTSNNANVLKSRGGSKGMSSKTMTNINGKNNNMHVTDNIIQNSDSNEANSIFTDTPNAAKGTGKGHHSGEELPNGAGTIYYKN